MDDQLLTRIGNVCNYYRGARWYLHFDSKDGGDWSVQMEAASPPEEEQQADPVAMLFTRRGNEPVFAMRCSSLSVIAEALEAWHAHSLSREL